MIKATPDEIERARALFDEVIGRARYSDAAAVLGLSSPGLSSKMKIGSIRLTDLLRVADHYNKEVKIGKVE